MDAFTIAAVFNEIQKAKEDAHRRYEAWMVGEAPGRDCVASRAHHCTGAFARALCGMSGVSLGDYLRAFHRHNVFPRPVKKWNARRAEENMAVFLQSAVCHAIRQRATRVSFVLAGTKVQDAAYSWIRPRWGGPVDPPGVAETYELPNLVLRAEVIRIPHPSGRCRLYNDPAVRARVGGIIGGIMRDVLHSSSLKQQAVRASNEALQTEK